MTLMRNVCVQTYEIWNDVWNDLRVAFWGSLLEKAPDRDKREMNVDFLEWVLMMEVGLKDLEKDLLKKNCWKKQLPMNKAVTGGS